MKIKGEYRDVLKKDEKVIADRGWKSNNIIYEDCSRFLAALMKKEFNNVGIEYMAVGGRLDISTGAVVSDEGKTFKSRMEDFFKNRPLDEQYENTGENYWVWARQIDEAIEMAYYDEANKEKSDKITNVLKIDVLFKNIPSKTLAFEEFALLGIEKDASGEPLIDATHEMFFINHASHGPITKDPSMELTRTIKLTFPLGGE